MDYSSNKIEHQGIVTEAGEKKIRVKISPELACESCKIKNICSVADTNEKYFDFINLKEKYEIGETVNLILKKSLAFKAILISYIIPLSIILISMFSFTRFIKSEGILILITILIVVFYYFILWLFRNRLSEKFSLTISKINLKGNLNE